MLINVLFPLQCLNCINCMIGAVFILYRNDVQRELFIISSNQQAWNRIKKLNFFILLQMPAFLANWVWIRITKLQISLYGTNKILVKKNYKYAKKFFLKRLTGRRTFLYVMNSSLVHSIQCIWVYTRSERTPGFDTPKSCKTLLKF